MALSPFFDDNDIVCQLRGFFELDEQWNIDFQGMLSQVVDVDAEYYELQINNRKFRIHKIVGNVIEVE